MSETTPAPQASGQPQQQPLVVNIQYVKDLSFEVPGAPGIFSQLRAQPQVNINLDVQARRIQDGQNVFEVAIVIFTLTGLPENAVEPVLLVECPRLLFPFARNILADVTRDGGFPPVLLQPIDFVALWQSRRAQAQQAQPTATA